MATPAPHPTRQQLDDLDALLQRMLALPVNPAEEPAPAAEPPALSPAPPPLEEPAGNMVLSEPLPVVTAPPPPSGNVVLADPFRPPPMPPVPAPVPLPLLNPVPPAVRRAPVLPPMPEPARSPRAALAASRPPEVFVLLRPVLGLNRAFDRLAFGLGAPGRWLRRPVGRTLLGLLGLLFLAAAAALVLLDRCGWTW